MPTELEAIVPIRQSAQSELKQGNLLKSLSSYTESLSLLPTDPIAYVERAMVYARLGYQELALVDALRANQIFESAGEQQNELSEYFALGYTVDVGMVDGKLSIPSLEIATMYSNEAYKNICYCVAFALTNLQLYGDSIHWYTECASRSSPEEKQQLDRRKQIVAQLSDKPGGILHSTSRYPWDERDLRKKNPTAVSNDIKQQIEQISSSCLTVRNMDEYYEYWKSSSTNVTLQLQLGIFATKSMEPLQTVLMEPEILCVNANIPSRPVCDYCNTTIFAKYLCPLCDITFCNENCYKAAQNKYHNQLCKKDLSALLRNINSNSTTKSLIPLHILKLFAVSKSTNTHPLDLPFVRNLTNIEYETNLHRPYDLKSFEDYMAVLHILELPLFKSEFDYWIFLTLDNLLTSNTFAYKTPDGIPWKGYILPYIAMINHSCIPNARLSLQDSRAEIITSRNLQKGTEVVISYIDIEAGMTKEERQKVLLNGWGFICRCERCIKE